MVSSIIVVYTINLLCCQLQWFFFDIILVLVFFMVFFMMRIICCSFRCLRLFVIMVHMNWHCDRLVSGFRCLHQSAIAIGIYCRCVSGKVGSCTMQIIHEMYFGQLDMYTIFVRMVLRLLRRRLQIRAVLYPVQSRMTPFLFPFISFIFMMLLWWMMNTLLSFFPHGKNHIKLGERWKCWLLVGCWWGNEV